MHVPDPASAPSAPAADPGRALLPAAEELAAWHRSPSLVGQLLVALACAGAAFLVRFALDPWLGNRQPFTPAFAAVAIAGWYGTWRAGLLCAVLSHLWANWFFVEPRGHFTLSDAELVGAASYYLIVAVLLVLSHRATTAIAARDAVLARLRRVDARRVGFLAALSHELRNPLGALRLALHELRMLPDRAAAVDRVSPMMERQLAQVARLCDDLTDIARIDQGKMSLDLQDVDPAELVHAAMEAVRPHLERRHQHLDLQLDAGGRARLDPQRVVQLVGNLLHNASKFSPDGATLSVSLRPEASQLCLRVSDPGAGIAADRLHTVFDAFAQGGGSREGLGLGLALVRRIAVLHGGSAIAHSEGEGRGASFEVRLPRG